MKGKTKIQGHPENYVWSSIRYAIIKGDKDDRGDGSTKSKEGWQGKKWNYTEIEISVVTPNMKEKLEEIFVCCQDDFERPFHFSLRTLAIAATAIVVTLGLGVAASRLTFS